MDEAEKSLAKLVAQMTTAQRQVFNEATQIGAPVLVRTFAVKRVKAGLPQPGLVPPAQKASVSSAPDPVKKLKERTLAKAYRAAFGGQVPMEILHAAFGDSVPRGIIAALTRPPE
jgi:hypothetical protein